MIRAMEGKDSGLSEMCWLMSKKVSLQFQGIKLDSTVVKAGTLGRIFGFAPSPSTSY